MQLLGTKPRAQGLLASHPFFIPSKIPQKVGWRKIAVSYLTMNAFQLEHTLQLLHSICPVDYRIGTIEYGKY